MELEELAEKFERLEKEMRAGVDQIQHAQRLNAFAVKRDFFDEVDKLRRELNDVASKMASLTEVEALKKQIGEPGSGTADSASSSELRAVRDEIGNLRKRISDLGDRSLLDQNIDTGAMRVFSEKLQALRTSFDVLKEDQIRQLDEVRMAMFATVDGLRRQIPLARDYSPSIEMLRSRVTSLETAKKSQGGKTDNPDNPDAAEAGEPSQESLVSRLKALEDQVMQPHDDPAGLFEAVDARLKALENSMGSIKASLESIERRMENISSNADFSEMSARLELLEKALNDRYDAISEKSEAAQKKYIDDLAELQQQISANKEEIFSLKKGIKQETVENNN